MAQTSGKVAVKGTGSGISFYEDSSRLVKGTTASVKAIKGIERALVYWCSAQGGFKFNTGAARDLANYMRQQLLSQEAFDYFTNPALSDFWVERKHELGLDPRKGVATESMANSIQMVRSGQSGYKVGISKNYVNPDLWRRSSKTGKMTKIGTMDTVYDYALLFEKGSMDGKQPPRPWFGITFLRWTRENLPKYAYRTVFKSLNQEVMNLAEASGSWVPAMQPEDMWRTYEGEAPAGITPRTTTVSGRQIGGEAVIGQEYTQYETPGKEAEVGMEMLPPSREPRGFSELIDVIGDGAEQVWVDSSGRYFNAAKKMWEDIQKYYRKRSVS